MERMQASEIKASVLASLEVREADPATLYGDVTQGELDLDATIPCCSPSLKLNTGND